MVGGAYSGEALINFFGSKGALIRGRRLYGGGAYSSNYGIVYTKGQSTIRILSGGGGRFKNKIPARKNFQ